MLKVFFRINRDEAGRCVGCIGNPIFPIPDSNIHTAFNCAGRWVPGLG
jgi:hypothetical protein